MGTKAEQIKELLDSGMTQVEIAKIVGVRQQYVSEVKCGWYKSNQVRKQDLNDRNEGKYSRMAFRRRKKKARKAGREFSISWKDLEHPTHCPILGIELDYSGKGEWGTQPSIDRINNDLGYIPGNVWIISLKANTLKKQKDLESFLKELSEV